MLPTFKIDNLRVKKRNKTNFVRIVEERHQQILIKIFERVKIKSKYFQNLLYKSLIVSSRGN